MKNLIKKITIILSVFFLVGCATTRSNQENSPLVSNAKVEILEEKVCLDKDSFKVLWEAYIKFYNKEY